MSGGMWKIVETKTGKFRMAETEERRGMGRSWEKWEEREERQREENKNQKKKRKIEVRKVAEEWEIWDEEEEVVKLKEEAKELVLTKLHK